MLKLSKRMEAVCALVPKCGFVWDVGCDHGYVPIYLIKNGICERAAATDVRPGPLERAKENIASYCLENKITTALSDGISADIEAAAGPGGVDCLIIAGMGGELTVNILSADIKKAGRIKNLILQPQSHIEKVRRFLDAAGFTVTGEDMVFEDGKYYPMMLVSTKKEDRDHKDSAGLYKSLRSSTLKSSAAKCPELPKEAIYRYGGLLIKNKHAILKSFLIKEGEIEAGIYNRLPDNDASPRRRELEENKRLRDLVLGAME